jgi:tetratricopeptide (TPR) repeat protein
MASWLRDYKKRNQRRIVEAKVIGEVLVARRRLQSEVAATTEVGRKIEPNKYAREEANMLRRWRGALLAFLVAAGSLAPASVAQETHEHGAPEVLGKVSFPVSCDASVQQGFTRAVALLHSFAYAMAEKAFREVAERDAHCAMAHWGVAMAHFHQIWDPPISLAGITAGQQEMARAQQLGGGSEREQKFINALQLIYRDAGSVPYRERAAQYEKAMADIAAANPKDAEAQVFYALALLANASQTDKTHAKQKQAGDLLEPLYRANPQHPGMAHYLIHAYDSAELAPRGLAAARAYSKIAPSAPHALHMPSHIFTRLGLWEDSIASNRAARAAAHEQGDIGEELHAMDYLVYAYLQSGRDAEAAQVIEDLDRMPSLNRGDFKVGYAAVAMPVRLVVERGKWVKAANIPAPSAGPPQVIAIAVWARGLGFARIGRANAASKEADRLKELEAQLRSAGNNYWAAEVGIQLREVQAWTAQARGDVLGAEKLLRAAADEEDSIEKLPVTPGPIVPAREQLGKLLLEQKQPAAAAREFAIALADAPGRRGAIEGAELAAK